MKEHRDFVHIYLNGKLYQLQKNLVFMMLADFLRYECNLTGTKIVCSEGDCGACTVLCRPSANQKNTDFFPINSCIATVGQFDGCHIITVEAIKQNGLSPIQEAMVDHHASQCGFCTPGFVMTLTALLEKPGTPTTQKIKNALTGNLCRCTGYVPIINAALAVDRKKVIPLLDLYPDPKPDDLCRLPILVHDKGREFFAPTTLEQAISYKQQGNVHIVGGTTDIGVTINKNKKDIYKLMSLHLIQGLDEITKDHDRIMIGARVTLEQLRRFMRNYCHSFSSFINIFASPQIKNMATVIGNIANASPIGDTLPFFLVTKAKLHVAGTEGCKTIDCEKFFIGYKNTALKDDEIITHLSFVPPHQHQHLKLEKISRRRDLDISSINAAFFCEVDSNNLLLKDVRIAFGGVDIVAKRLYLLEKFLANKALDENLINESLVHLKNELSPINDVRGSIDFRLEIALKFMKKFFMEVMHEHKKT